MIRIYLTILLSSVFLSVYAQNFTTSTKSGVDLRLFDTFTVVRGDLIVEEDAEVDKDAFFERIKAAIVKELGARGYRYQDDSLAQLRVSYVVETSSRMDVVELGPMGQAPTTNPAMMDQSRNWSRDIRQGSLILEIEDASKSSVIWSSEGVMDASRTRGGNLIDYAVQRAFYKFPDKTKKMKSSSKKSKS